MTLEIKELPTKGYERVIEGIDHSVGLHCLIAVHNTSMGPALGGTRMYPYTSVKDALFDVLRLSRGMTYKSAVAEIGLGGGKSVLIGDPKRHKTEELLYAFGRVVDSLEGLYICAEDMGITTRDMTIIRQATKYVVALPNANSSGDPAPFTAWGILRGFHSVAKKLWGSESLRGKKVAIQGVGSVGTRLAEHLFWEGALLILSDKEMDTAMRLATRLGAECSKPDEILSSQCDILAPCAIGGIINSESISRLRCKAIAGAANNQLLTPEDGSLLVKRNILYAPDFVINAGGIINVSFELDEQGYRAAASREKVNGIYETLQHIFHIAEKNKIPTSLAADQLAEHKLQHGIGKRMVPVSLHA